MKTGVEDGHVRRRSDKMRRDNQLANKMQTGGKVPADKGLQHVVRQRQRVARQRQLVARRRWWDKRTKCGVGATTGATRQPAGKQEAKANAAHCEVEAVP